jgi:hypothetical protein
LHQGIIFDTDAKGKTGQIIVRLSPVITMTESSVLNITPFSLYLSMINSCNAPNLNIGGLKYGTIYYYNINDSTI